MIMQRDTTFNTMDNLHLAILDGMASRSNNTVVHVRHPRINANTNNYTNNNNNNNAESVNRSISLRPAENKDTLNVFAKFAFPFKLHAILEDSSNSNNNYDAIISWHPSGLAFKIHKPKEFATTILPHYFPNQTKFRSFQRQLYIYGFERIKTRSRSRTGGVDNNNNNNNKKDNTYGAYFHQLFLRGATDLCLGMERKKIKGTGLSNDERRRRKMAFDEGLARRRYVQQQEPQNEGI